METWFIFAVLSAVFFWLTEFVKKIVAKNWLNKNKFLLFSAFFQLLTSFIYFLYVWSYFYMTLLFWVLIVLRIILVIEKNSTAIESLKYIDSSLFFPVNKLIKIWWWFIIWMFLFGEYLDNREYIFLFLWTISVLLIWYKKSSHKAKDFKKWVFYLLLSSFILVCTSTINKFIWENHDPALYLLLSNIVGLVYIAWKIKFKDNDFSFKIKEFKYGAFAWILGFMAFAFLLYALWDWKLVIIQLISTIAMFIPIVLSFIFSWEKINRYKFIGLVLFLINLFIFYINK
jgi:uncharacterized membrane protein